MQIPQHQIRADYDDDTIVVYQAYRPAIAQPALQQQRFVDPFKMTRMTWIKPSFLWMMYRCGWGLREGQEYVLRIRLTRAGFEEALSLACLSSAAKQGIPATEWPEYKARFPVRVQRDPERNLHLHALEHRSLQVGLSGRAVQRYVHDWIVSIEDYTPLAREIHALVQSGDLDAATQHLPLERPYPTSGEWRSRLKLST